MSKNTNENMGCVIIYLLKGVLYRDRQPAIWELCLNYQGAIRDYVQVIGLGLYIDEAEGYAFLRQNHEEDVSEDSVALPTLIQRRPLSYPVSLLCVCLRKKMIEQDTAGGDTRLILTRDQLIDMMQVLMPERNNEAKTVELIDSCINRIIEFGFLRRLTTDSNRFEIQRIIKAFVDGSWLGDLDIKIAEYTAHANATP